MKFFNAHPSIVAVAAALVFLSAGAALGFFISQRQMASCENRHALINAGVACVGRDVVSKAGYIKTRGQTNEFIEAEREAGRIDEASVYFRDLKNGPIMGINELADFAPASLIKLPLALVYMNFVERDSAFLGATIEYSGTPFASETVQHFSPRETAESERPYTVEELLKLMLVYSDNISYEVLYRSLVDSPARARFGRETFKEIGFITPESDVDEVVSVRGYASIFRILYNASYLSAENSEKMLAWLAQSDFDVGLEAGVPPDVAVAHKFGERFTDDGLKQLHDCGIVYYPRNPYLLCVMTRGHDWDELVGVIATISKMVYEEVDARWIR